MEYLTSYESPLGNMTLVSNGTYLTGLWFAEDKHYGRSAPKEASITASKDLPIFKETIAWLNTYFSGKIPDSLPKIQLHGSDFRQRVWSILLTIPYGQTMTYGQIGHIIAKERHIPKMSAQAVGGAVGHNPISILVPCHRVIGANGNLTGYAGGVDKKVKLLELEGVTVPLFYHIRSSNSL